MDLFYFRGKTVNQLISCFFHLLKEAQDKRHELELSIEKIDNQIEEYMMKIEENKKNITSTENDIEKYKKEILRVEEEVIAQQDLLDQRVKSIYMNGQSD